MTKIMASSEIVEFIVKKLWNGPNTLNSPKKWTGFVKDALRSKFKNSRCYTSSLSGADREYLVDICLAEECEPSHKPAFRHANLLLAVECEWDGRSDERCYDFAKLADIRAKRKLFIGAIPSKSWNTRDTIIAEMLAYINQHRLIPDGEEYAVVLNGYGTKQSLYGWVLKKNNSKARLIVKKTELKC